MKFLQQRDGNTAVESLSPQQRVPNREPQKYK